MTFLLILLALFAVYNLAAPLVASVKNDEGRIIEERLDLPVFLGRFSAGAVLTVSILSMMFNPIGRNDIGYRVIVESPAKSIYPNKVVFDNGWYFKMPRSKITTYPDVITIQYGTEDEKGDDVTFFAPPHGAKFNGGDDTRVGHTVKWDMPDNEAAMLGIHSHYRNHQRLASTTLSQFQSETMAYSTQRMDSEAHYSGGQSQLKEYFQDQLRNGQVLLDKNTVFTYDTTYIANKMNIEKITKIEVTPRVNATTGLPIRTESDIQKYEISPSFVSIDHVKYTKLIEDKLKAKIESATKKSISEQLLITAQQEALTAIEQGKKNIETTRATKEAEKLEAVIEAQKIKDVAEQDALAAKFNADKMIAEGRAQAEVDKLKNIAGLSPLERAKIDQETAIGVAAELAKLKFPEMLIIGGGDKGGNSAMNPFDAVGLESFHRLSKKMSSNDQ